LVQDENLKLQKCQFYATVRKIGKNFNLPFVIAHNYLIEVFHFVDGCLNSKTSNPGKITVKYFMHIFLNSCKGEIPNKHGEKTFQQCFAQKQFSIKNLCCGLHINFERTHTKK